MPPDFFSGVKTAATSPYALVAYICLLVTYAYVTIARYRLKNISRNIEKVPERDRAALLAREYSTFPRTGLSAEQWVRSRKNMLFFLALIALIVAAAVVGVTAISAARRPAQLSIKTSSVDGVEFNVIVQAELLSGIKVTGPLPQNWPPSARRANYIVQDVLLVELDNVGKIPSAAKDFHLKVRNPSTSSAIDLDALVEPTMEVKTPHHEKLLHIEKSWLYSKALAPIQPGAPVCGYLVFMIPDPASQSLWYEERTLVFKDIQSIEHSTVIYPVKGLVPKVEYGYAKPNPCVEENVTLPAR